MSTKSFALKSLLAAMIAGAAAPALALNAATDAMDVTIHEGAIPGTPANTVVADQLSGQYDEIFSTTGGGPSTFNFNSLAVFNAGGWFNNGSAQSGYLNFLESGGGYKLYAMFQANGTYSISSGVASFSAVSGALQLWADPLSDSGPKTLPGTAAGKTISDITVGASGDDILLGTANLLTFGNGNGNFGSGANGNFEIVFGDWALCTGAGTPDSACANGTGDGYFFAPKPFYMVLDVNGNFQSFDPTSQTDILIPQSSANAFFTVPEPGTVALLGLGLVGLGLSHRRKS